MMMGWRVTSTPSPLCGRHVLGDGLESSVPEQTPPRLASALVSEECVRECVCVAALARPRVRPRPP